MNYSAKARLGWLASMASYLLQIVLLVLMTMVWPPQGKSANLVVCVILVAPLLPFLPFLLRRSIRAHVWLCFLSLFYLMMAVPSGFDPRYGLLGRLELANVMLLFVFTLCFARWEQRRLGISVTR